MKIYLTIIEGKYRETDAFPFNKSEDALRFARKIALDNCDYMEDFKEEEKEGLLYYAHFSCEGGCVWVVEKNLMSYPPISPEKSYPPRVE